MALGGGSFLTQNKILPGSYINFVSTSTVTASLSDRGYATMPMELDWGTDGEIFTVTNEDFQKDCLKIFGYGYTHSKLKPLRDLFLNAKTVYLYRLNSGSKSYNAYAKARCSGVRGNDLKLSIYENADDGNYYDVSVLWDNIEVESQTVATFEDLQESEYVIWRTSLDPSNPITLTPTAGLPLEGGTNREEVTGLDHQNYLNLIEPYAFNVMGVVTTDDTLKQLYVNFTKRLRDEVGAKFQLVVHQCRADYEGVINVTSEVPSSMLLSEMEEFELAELEEMLLSDLDSGSEEHWSEASLVYWVTGLEASCAVNKSCLNQLYNGEFDVKCEYTQAQLVTAIGNGEFVLHKVGSDMRVLADINSLTTLTESKNEIFQENQTMRVCDGVANDIALLFNTKYLGQIPNDEAGRISLWTDIVIYYAQLQDIRAIEGFVESDVTVEQGSSKKSVLVGSKLTVVNAMAQLYMTVKVS